MNLVFSLVVAVLFGTGIYLLLSRDLIRVIFGTNLISTAVIVFIVANSLSFGRAPIYPLPDHLALSDPVVQALALTAIVINYGATALALTLVYRVYTTSKTLDADELQHLNEEDQRRTQPDGRTH